jgi:para-nitrobenzyl esterase
MVIVSTSKGKIKGVQESDHQTFFGIPYAKSPTGNLRFVEPNEMESWEDIKDTTKFKNIPPQNYPDDPPIEQEENEDCLYLNIWTPLADDKKRPVMFWIYGGGFLIGAGSRPRLNGKKLCVYGDVVVVTFNYRIGALGFLNSTNIPPNIGILDQIAALNWVQENILNFGGDPENITIFGESAGGMSVAILLSIPTTRGLFHKAIMQSGAANPQMFEPEEARKGAKEYLSKLNVEEGNIADLKKIPLKTIIETQFKITGTFLDAKIKPFRPFIDGKVIPEQPIELLRKGNGNYVPLIIGYNSEELGVLADILKDSNKLKRKLIQKVMYSRLIKSGIKKRDLDNLIEIYKREIKVKYPNNPFKYLSYILSDSMFRMPIIRQIEAQLNHQSNIFNYIFEYNSPKFGYAMHTFEIPFVFGTLNTIDIANGAVEENEEAESLSKTIMDTWVSFARDGDPNHQGIPKWLPYDINNRTTMILGINPKLELNPMDNLREAWEGIL